MKYIKLFENFTEGIIPQEIIDNLKSTGDERILSTLKDLEIELNGEKDEDKLRAYVDDIGVYLNDANMSEKEADNLYFSLVSIVDREGIDTIGPLDWKKDLEELDDEYDHPEDVAFSKWSPSRDNWLDEGSEES